MHSKNKITVSYRPKLLNSWQAWFRIEDLVTKETAVREQQIYYGNGAFGKGMLMFLSGFDLMGATMYSSEVKYKGNAKAVVQRCSVKKVFLNISQNSQENTCARFSFLIKLQTWCLQFYYKRDCHRCFPVNFAIFLRTPFFYRTPLVAAYGNDLFFQFLFCWTTGNADLKKYMVRFALTSRCLLHFAKTRDERNLLSPPRMFYRKVTNNFKILT